MPARESTEALTPTSAVAARQQPDGGWGYGRSPWTEPTALAVLALHTEPGNHRPVARAGVDWLIRNRRPDGGWPPNPGVDQSVTWATALALLAINAVTGAPCTESVRWLLATSGKESGIAFRLRQILSGIEIQDRQGFEGWPWYPGTAAWVAPTSLAILALGKTRILQPPHLDRHIRERINVGREFLLARRCLDGGWNHGSSRPLGYEADSYPETTGVALMGLLGLPPASLQKSLQRAEAEFAECRSAQGRAWLRLALLSHNYSVPASDTGRSGRDIPDAALAILADSAQRGKNVFSE